MTSICCRGFTLIELVITMVMMGILSAVVVTDISARAQHSVTTQADQFRRNLSHLQLLAISRGARLRLTVAAGGGGYSVATCATSACTTRSALVDPATGLNFSVTLTDGVTLSPAGNILDFDSMGRPQSGGSLITATRSYTLTGSGRSVSVTVLPVTGFARTSY
jgi:prepilin-type N-terminal cleavage/methylation domain-containing protein